MAFHTAEQKEQLRSLLLSQLPNTTSPSNPAFAPGVVFGVTNDKETVFLESSGVKSIDTKEPLGKDAIFSFFSCSKAITAVAVLQLVEKNLIDLDAPASKYLPLLGRVKLLKGYDENKKPIWDTPKTEITTRSLLTHTAGFSYTFFSQEYADVRAATGDLCIFDIRENLFDEAFLINEPGLKWHYGLNIDFAGKIVEAITGQSLGDYCKKNIFEPAELTSFTFEKPESQPVTLHIRSGDDVVLNNFQADTSPVHHLGGSGIFGKVEDYLKFIRIWLNDGKADNGNQILSAESVEHALQKHVDGVEPIFSFESEFSVDVPHNADQPDGWSLAFAVNATDVPTGRPKGSFYWCGIANLFYWIDTTNRIGGFYASQIFPFLEKSVANFGALEAEVYKHV